MRLKNSFLKEWWRDYRKACLSVFVSLIVAFVVAWRLGYGFNPRETVEYYLGKTIAIASPPKITVGSCYPYQYGLDMENRSLHFYPFPEKKPITFPRGKYKLHLAISSNENLLSLEGARLHVSFPQGTTMTDPQGNDLSNMERKQSPWVCLGTGDGSCYYNLDELNPGSTLCFEPMMVTFPSTDNIFAVGFQTTAKNRPSGGGKFFVQLQ